MSPSETSRDPQRAPSADDRAGSGTARGWRRSATAALAAAAVSGAVIWALSPALTGKAEPWDSETRYFVTALSSAGLALGLVQPKRAFQHWLGVILGQLAWEIVALGAGPLFVVGLLLLPLWSLPTMLGSLLGSSIRWLVSRLARNR